MRGTNDDPNVGGYIKTTTCILHASMDLISNQLVKRIYLQYLPLSSHFGIVFAK
jgi:hypothetical protein